MQKKSFDLALLKVYVKLSFHQNGRNFCSAGALFMETTKVSRRSALREVIWPVQKLKVL